MTRADESRRLVKKVRKQLDLTSQQLADMLGVSQSTIVRWESGERLMRESNLRLLKIVAEREGVRV